MFFSSGAEIWELIQIETSWHQPHNSKFLHFFGNKNLYVLVCSWCYIFSLLQYCILAGFGDDFRQFVGRNPSTRYLSRKVSHVGSWSPLVFNLFLFSLTFFCTFPFYSCSPLQLLSCLCVYFFVKMKHAVFIACWGLNQSQLRSPRNASVDQLSMFPRIGRMTSCP